MTIKYKFLILFSIITVGLSSCIGIRTNKHLQNSPLGANFRFEMTWSDLEYLGEVKASADWTTYLGFIKVHNYQRDVTYTLDGGQRFLNTGILGTGGTDELVKRALYAVIEENPSYQEADFIIPVQTKTEATRMFLGTKRTQTLKVKLYKLKENR
jgi:hypothetical protein